MLTKLTLTADKEVVKKIKRVAREQGTSVSAMFDRFARAVSASPKKPREVGPLTRKASGLIKYSGKKSDRQLIEEALAEKYGL